MTLVPEDVAAAALNVKPATIRKLVQRGHLTRHGGPRRARYDLREIADLRRAA